MKKKEEKKKRYYTIKTTSDISPLPKPAMEDVMVVLAVGPTYNLLKLVF